MTNVLEILPTSFWMVILLLTIGAIWAIGNVWQGIGFPVLAVLATTAAWYVGDAFYNDYADNHAKTFTPDLLSAAWWQVTLFLVTFLVLTQLLHGVFNQRFIPQSSQIMTLFQNGVANARFQSQLTQLFWGCVSIWFVMVVVAVARLGDQIPYYFFPFLAYKADPWGRGQIGGGALDAFLALAMYFQMFVTVIFGITGALAEDQRVRRMALILCLMTWPYYIFDRTRNYMLAVILPAIAAWVFLRLRVAFWQRLGILAVVYVLLNFWFEFVIANRSNTSIVAAFQGEGSNFQETKDAHHEGLNMFEELCWVNRLIEAGTYQPNWGERYFAELVNPIPRGLWHNKPLIGLDYAIARGQSYNDDGSVTATISTGMIGQGVANFGTVGGPAFAGLLMSLWAVLLARFDLCGAQIGRIPLFALGLVLTFNLGRDITLITLYTFVFGYGIVRLIERRLPVKAPHDMNQDPPADVCIPEERRRIRRQRTGYNRLN